MFSDIPSVDEKVQLVLNETVNRGFTEDNFETLLLIAEVGVLDKLFGLSSLSHSRSRQFVKDISSSERIITSATSKNVVFI